MPAWSNQQTKGKIRLKPESISIIEAQAPWDILGNKKYHLNPEAYLPQGIIPLDLVHSFKKTPRTLKTANSKHIY